MVEGIGRNRVLDLRGTLRKLRLAGVIAGAYLALAWSASGHAQTAGDWPQYRFDSARDGRNPDETILSPSTVGGLKEIWSFTADGIVPPSPAVVDNVLYVASGNGTFYALDAATGALIWKRTIIGS